jgi:catechol 2,3-dioxygenase-like lactoylglutathione lyase family enzyme
VNVRTLNLLVLRSPNMDAARLFYETFGMRFERHAHGAGPEHYASEDARGVLEIYPAAAADTVGLGFACDDLEAARVALADAGHQPGLIKDNPWGRTFVVRDPDGRRVEVKQDDVKSAV